MKFGLNLLHFLFNLVDLLAEAIESVTEGVRGTIGGCLGQRCKLLLNPVEPVAFGGLSSGRLEPMVCRRPGQAAGEGRSSASNPLYDWWSFVGLRT